MCMVQLHYVKRETHSLAIRAHYLASGANLFASSDKHHLSIFLSREQLDFTTFDSTSLYNNRIKNFLY